jgi:ABC-type multidrug transport system ATPase subunit
LLGRNGSGKTTLLRVAVGEVRARTGFIRFLSKVYDYPSLAVLARRGLYYIEERGRLPGTFPVRAHLEFVSNRFRRQPLDDVVAALAIEDLLDKKFHVLSGGEARRAVLAGALIREPKCLLVDEPFLGIMPKDEKMVADALRGLAAGGSAVVATGHEVEALLGVADDVIWCVAGTTHGLGGPEEARAHPEFAREYLGSWRRGEA